MIGQYLRRSQLWVFYNYWKTHIFESKKHNKFLQENIRETRVKYQIIKGKETMFFRIFEMLTDWQSFHCWLTPQLFVTAQVGPEWRQKPGSQSWSPMWVAGIELLIPSVLSLRVCISRKLESRAKPGLKPRFCYMWCRHINWCLNCQDKWPPERILKVAREKNRSSAWDEINAQLPF